LVSSNSSCLIFSLCSVLLIIVSFCSFLLAIALSILLQFTASHYLFPYSIFLCPELWYNEIL
jgi:hypothetical protein